MKRTQSATDASGFTLIEILAVLVILGILTTVLITQLVGGREAADIEATRRLLARIGAAVDHYEREFGDFPDSSFAPEQSVANEGINVGGEALVVSLWSKGWEAGGLLPDIADGLVNLDGDRSNGSLTDFGTRDLFEIADAWENPVAYLHRRDYEKKTHEYLSLDPSTGEEQRTFVRAYKNPVTKRFISATRYQLISAGPDGRFDTEDDVTTFDR